MSMKTKAGLVLDDIEIRLKDQPIVKIDAFIRSGEVLTLMGPSGSGKSTLLSYIGGFLAHEFRARGNILLDGNIINSLPPEQRKAGLLFQDALLFPHFSVLQNLLYAIPSNVKPKQIRIDKVKEALERIDMADFIHADPHTLSGGQKARIALMRVLLSEPKMLLLDEPFSSLDTELRTQVRQLVFDEIKSRQLPAVLVTHDEVDSKAAGGQMIALKS